MRPIRNRKKSQDRLYPTAKVYGKLQNGERAVLFIFRQAFSRFKLYVANVYSTYISTGMLASMVLSLVMVRFWRRGNPRLPLEPTTLGSVCSCLCAGLGLKYPKWPSGKPLGRARACPVARIAGLTPASSDSQKLGATTLTRQNGTSYE